MKKTLRVWSPLFAIAVVICACQQKDMGYCFDTAYDPGGQRLYVAAGKAGLHILDASGGQLKYRETYQDGGYYRNLEIHGDWIFVADVERGLVALDISGEQPETAWSFGKVGMGLILEGSILYLAAGKDGLYGIDVRDPQLPKVLFHEKTIQDAWDVWAQDGWVYIADYENGLVILDARDPGAPRRAGALTWDQEQPMAEVVYGQGSFIYIAAGEQGLVAVDARDPTAPELASTYKPGADSFAEGVFAVGQTVYLTVGDQAQKQHNGLHILDATDPYRLKVLQVLPLADWVEGVSVAGNLAFVANTYSGVWSAEVSPSREAFLIDHFSRLP